MTVLTGAGESGGKGQSYREVVRMGAIATFRSRIVNAELPASRYNGNRDFGLLQSALTDNKDLGRAGIFEPNGFSVKRRTKTN